MRAQSLQDPAADRSDRPDHGPMGAYAGWPPETVDGLCHLGYWQDALDFYRRCEAATHEGAFSQGDEFYGPKKRDYDAPVRIARRRQAHPIHRRQQPHRRCRLSRRNTIRNAQRGPEQRLWRRLPQLLERDTHAEPDGGARHRWRTVRHSRTGNRYADLRWPGDDRGGPSAPPPPPLAQSRRLASLLLAALGGIQEREDLQRLLVRYRRLTRLEELHNFPYQRPVI